MTTEANIHPTLRDPNLLTSEEAAVFLNIKLETFRQYYSKKVPADKKVPVGRRVLFPKSELEKLIPANITT